MKKGSLGHIKLKSLILSLCLLFSASLLFAVSAPEIKFDEISWDFGKINQGNILNHVFVFHNTGNATLHIERISTSCGCTAALVSVKEKMGLLIIAHGAPHEQWNRPVLNLEKEVKELILQKGKNPFCEIKVALMEFNEPSIYTTVKNFEKQGVEKIYALPIFIAPSRHSMCDIPTILGLYKDKKILNQLKEEGIKIVDTNIKITLGPTLNYGNLLKEIMLDRVKELSTNINKESLIILAHGDKNYYKVWSDMCREIGSYICGKTGIKYFNYAFVEVGQSFTTDGVLVILKANEKYKKTIVVGLYLSMGVKSMSEKCNEIFKRQNIVFSNKGLLPDKRVSKWIVSRALEWVEENRSEFEVTH